MNRILIFIYLVIASTSVMAQIGGPVGAGRRVSSDGPSYLNPKEYTVGGITITGTKYLINDVLIAISKLSVGQHIMVPGEATSTAVKTLWEQNLFDDVKLNITQIKGDSIFFEIAVVERPRLTKINILGVSKGQVTELMKKLEDTKGKVINENLYNTTTNIIKKHYNDKGYLFTEVDIKERQDTAEANNKILDVTVHKHSKVKVNSITFEGNENFKDSQLKKFMKKTHERAFYKVFGSGKYLNDKYEEDKTTVVSKMQDKGYRDASILSDTVLRHDNKSMDITIHLNEGNKYYFGNITWAGNAIYTTEYLNKLLAIQKGDVFSEENLDKRLHSSPNSDDISTLYLDNGYLTFNIDPIQTKIYGDTVDIELRLIEGPQYTVNKVILKGNDITNDKVVMREIRTKPGDKFSKNDIVRTTREIAQLGNFDEQKTNVNPIPNPADGTVDIEYTVQEKPSDQVELSGGFGGGRVIGTLGLTFNNFAARNLFNLKEWKPLPKGDGQKLSLRGQTNGKQYQSYSFSFSEPWFGGKQKVYFGISAFTSLQSNQFYKQIADEDLQRIRLNGVTFSLGKQLKWPDDWFALNYSLNLQQYKLKNYPGFLFSTGTSYNFNITQELSRNSLDGSPVFPKNGSNIKFTVQLTPPYSLINNINYATATDKTKYRFTEYNKWKFEAQWYQRIYGNLILKAQTQFGFLGQYNKAAGQSAFERFKLGGDGMQGFDYLQGSEVIAMRGYNNNTVIPVGSNPDIAQKSGSPIFNKYILELRHPVINSQQAQVFALAFAEGGNTWDRFRDFAPFNIRRSVGVGARIYLAIFGLMGIDYGYGFDKIPGLPDANKGQFHFSISQSLGGF